MLLLPEEMWRTVVFFRFWEDWWEDKAKEMDKTKEAGQAAYARK